MSRDFQIAMQGRILALELFVRQLLADKVAEAADPIETAERLKTSFLASLQHLDRPVDEYSDQVWDAAADAIRLQLDAIIHRFASRHGRTR